MNTIAGLFLALVMFVWLLMAAYCLIWLTEEWMYSRGEPWDLREIGCWLVCCSIPVALCLAALLMAVPAGRLLYGGC